MSIVSPSIPLRIYKSCLFQFSTSVFGSFNVHLPKRSLDHVDTEVLTVVVRHKAPASLR